MRHLASRLWRPLQRTIKLRLVLMFLLLALGLALVVIVGVQKAFSVGWRDAARPLLKDYIDRISTDIGSPPSVERARALSERLPITVRISGPQVNWASHPEVERARQRLDDDKADDGDEENAGAKLFKRRSADGHQLAFGINQDVFEQRSLWLWKPWLLGALLSMTLAAYLYVRRLLRPLDAIRMGAERFGAGNFDTDIPVANAKHPDEFGQLAHTINTMGQDIHHMLQAKRALLLAISHELRSPLTRARLNTELLPETEQVNPQREALLRDLQEMARLVSDLLESERLSSRHAALHTEPTDVRALAQEVIRELQSAYPKAAQIVVQADTALPPVTLDRTRVRLLLRNLLDNALRHSAQSDSPPELSLRALPGTVPGQRLEAQVRDHGTGVAEEQLPLLGQAFHRPDSARSRNTGGIGLGLYICKLVTQAHGGDMLISNAQPGLRVTVRL